MFLRLLVLGLVQFVCFSAHARFWVLGVWLSVYGFACLLSLGSGF